MRRSPVLLLRSSWTLLAVLAMAGAAHAEGECEVDADCGHGFSCFESVASAGHTASGSGGAMSGTGGSVGTGGGSFAPAAGTSGVPIAGTSGTAPPPQCGNSWCEPSESVESCPADCVVFTYCGPAECTGASDCAEGYVCPEATLPGTGGGPNGPFCGDGLCTGEGENADTCPDDCFVPRHCALPPGYCTSDADCLEGYKCRFIGAGERPGTGGTSSGALPPFGGECVPGPDVGNGGTSGTGAGGLGGAAGLAGSVAVAGTSPGGTGSATTGSGGTSATTGSGGTSTTTGSGGTGDAGAGARHQGGNGSAPSGTGGDPSPDVEHDEVVVTHGGCSITRTETGSASAVALLALGAALVLRRRRS